MPTTGTIWVRASDSDEHITYHLEAGSALVLGRAPSPDRLPLELRRELGDAPIRCEQLSSSRVSGNHVLIWHTGGTLRLWDLASRNGTWMKLHPQQPFEVGEQLALALQLAPAEPVTLLDQPPQPAEWRGERDFTNAVAESLRRWLHEHKLYFQILEHWPILHEESPEPRFPLANGSELRISPAESATQNIPWSTVLDRIYAYVNEQNSRFELLQGHEEGFILASRGIREAHRKLADAAMRSMRVLLLGPTGSGKERLARCYHLHSRQHRGPFAALNCSLLSPDLMYAQLFGAKKGSFTGCTSDFPGILESANEGTLFLDEIGEMNLEVQRALLRFLDTRGEYQRLGDTQTRHADVQIVCATNVELDDPQRRAGRFREDLWYRLAVRIVRIPPLRERREDIATYLRWYRLSDELSAYEALTPAALQRVLSDPWPGNFRGLKNFLDRLPHADRPHAIDEQICAAALAEDRAAPPTESGATPGPAAAAQAGWPEIVAQAVAAFVDDHGPQPGQWGQLAVFTEKYLKPVFLAHACGLSQIDEVKRSLNLSGLARRMDIADGTTVKLQLQKYIERFRKSGYQES